MHNEINVFQHVQTAPRMQQNAPFEIITFKKFLGRPFPQIPLPRRWKISFPHPTPPARSTIPSQQASYEPGRRALPFPPYPFPNSLSLPWWVPGERRMLPGGSGVQSSSIINLYTERFLPNMIPGIAMFYANFTPPPQKKLWRNVRHRFTMDAPIACDHYETGSN